MTHAGRHHQYTVGLAEKALRFIKAHLLPADPPSFEVWYTYAGRFIPQLNQAIDEAIAARGTVSALEIDRIYDRHLGTFRLSEQVEKIGENVGNELDQALGTFNAAIASAARYDDRLTDLVQQLERPLERSGLKAILEALISETHAAAHEGLVYQIRLETARGEIARLRSDLEAIRFESRTDALTALFNCRQLDQALNGEIARATQNSEVAERLRSSVNAKEIVQRSTSTSLGRITVSLGLALAEKTAQRVLRIWQVRHSVESQPNEASSAKSEPGRDLHEKRRPAQTGRRVNSEVIAGSYDQSEWGR